MLSTVTPKRNHYERLGLALDAGADEVAQAFATAMSPLMPRSVTDLVEIALAFETLRDPAKRRTYDALIAPIPAEPEPPQNHTPADRETKLMFPRDGWPITPSARIGSVELPAIHALPRAAQKAEPTPLMAPQPQPEAARPREARSDYRSSSEDGFNFVPQEPVEWRRPASVVVALFVSVAVIGAGLGWYASRGIAPAQAEDVLSAPMAGATAPVAEPPGPREDEAKAIPEHRPRPAAGPAQTRHTEPHPEPIVSEDKRAEDVPDIPSEQVATLTSQAEDALSVMPLPDAIVARTIRKIGYACGEVASTTAMDSAPGVFKVTCTSGESYKATPVRGRYRFRRWAGN